MQAVDLYVLERAFISTHENSEPLVNEVMRSYKVRVCDCQKASVLRARVGICLTRFQPACGTDDWVCVRPTFCWGSHVVHDAVSQSA